MQQKQGLILNFIIIISLILSINIACKKNNTSTQMQPPTPPTGFAFIPAPGEKDSIGRIEDGIAWEKPRHRILLSPFFMAKYELTVKEFNGFIQDGYQDTTTQYASKNNKGDNHPVVWVSWLDAARYCNWLSKKQGLDTCYVFAHNRTDVVNYNFGTPDNPKNGYHLPTEAEWEYACRAHSDSAYTIGNTGKNTITTADANFNVPLSDENKSVPVNSYKPNNFGLYNMHGNILEWCSDYINDDYYKKPEATQLNPLNTDYPIGNNSRVIRSGSWASDASQIRSDFRYFAGGNETSMAIGFRLVKRI